MKDNKFDDYEKWVPRWDRVRRACAGQAEVKEAKTKFLAKLPGQTPQQYDSYILGAVYTNYSGRTLKGLLGMIYRKLPQYKIPTAFEPIWKDLDLQGASAIQVSRNVTTELMVTGGCGVLVEYPKAPKDLPSKAIQEALNLRPYSALYTRESILDYRIERVNNSAQLVMVKLLEKVSEWDQNYASKSVDQLRMLILEQEGYLQRVYRKKAGTGEWLQFGEDIIPTMGGARLPFIPFWPFGTEQNHIKPQKAALEDLAEVNLAHYRTSASYERGCMFTGAPTPMLAGFDLKENEKVVLGSTTAMCSTNPQAKWGYLEFTGQGLRELASNMQAKEAQMAALGARMLAPEKTGVEAEGALKMRSNGESCALADLAVLQSEAFTELLKFMATWLKLDAAEISFKLNTDYLPAAMSAADLLALVKTWQAGAMPLETLFDNLKRGEIVDASQNFEDFKELIESQNPLGELNDGE